MVDALRHSYNTVISRLYPRSFHNPLHTTNLQPHRALLNSAIAQDEERHDGHLEVDALVHQAAKRRENLIRTKSSAAL